MLAGFRVVPQVLASTLSETPGTPEPMPATAARFDCMDMHANCGRPHNEVSGELTKVYQEACRPGRRPTG
jgi:hypothetical protein